MHTLFSECGNLNKFKIIHDKWNPPYRSRGFGFAMFTTEKSALAAVERFNGFTYKGRKLTVKMSK